MDKNDKKYDALEVLSKVSGVPRSKANEIYELVKLNIAILDGCDKPHNFVNDAGQLPRDARCTNCGGVLRVEHARWYRQGLSDARDESER